jgi:hypothetical protein
MRTAVNDEPGREPASAGRPRRLLDAVRDAIRLRHYSRRTEEAYVAWIRRFIVFHGKRHPRDMGGPEVTAFVSSLAAREVSASTQNQALSAILFLYQAVLHAYGIKYLPFARFDSPVPLEQATSRVDDPFYQWFLSQEASFEHLWEKLTDESFHILFANRSFLLKFNRAVSERLRGDPSLVPPEERGVAGRIRRRSPPAWARSAVFFRDQGRCVLCHVDLSGLLSTDRVDHFDHMVPLAEWGINDACNLQLLCEACNLKKSAGEAVTGNRYSAWWRY